MKIKDYNDAIEFFRTNDYQAANGAWSEFYQSKVLEPRIMDLADGGRIGFFKGERVGPNQWKVKFPGLSAKPKGVEMGDECCY
jgi:hypothetical protein